MCVVAATEQEAKSAARGGKSKAIRDALDQRRAVVAAAASGATVGPGGPVTVTSAGGGIGGGRYISRLDALISRLDALIPRVINFSDPNGFFVLFVSSGSDPGKNTFGWIAL